MKLLQVNYYEFIDFVKGLSGKTVYTMTQKKSFEVTVRKGGLLITPLSSMKERWHSKNFIIKVHERFNDLGSLKVSDYNDITAMASYHLALLKIFIETANTSTSS